MTPCVAVCVWERERAPATEQKHLCEWLEPHFSPSRLSLSLIFTLSSSHHIILKLLKLLKKILRYGHSYSECAQFQFRFSLSTPSVYTHTHTSLSMSPSGLTSSLNLDISSMCPPTTWDHLVRSESLWEVEQLSHLCPPPYALVS